MSKILIVEDDFALADNLAAFLKLKGYDPHHAPDGPSGVEAARKLKPEVILLDVRIPRIDGFDVCRLLRSDEKTKGIKIIMVTGLGQMGDVEKALSCGASDYLIKPFDTDRLLKKIEKALH
ncbi:MAG: response regulator [Elusimicrobia bacterium]|nr:response regulator [Elusimicrobiota bacterium]